MNGFPANRRLGIMLRPEKGQSGEVWKVRGSVGKSVVPYGKCVGPRAGFEVSHT